MARQRPAVRRRQASRRPVTRGGGGSVQPTGSFDYDAFNSWDDPNISGQEPGPIQQGWGGFGNVDDTMLKTKMNNYLNQQAVGGPRETMMNQMGYFNQGNPYTPVVGRGVNRAMRAQARGNQQSGARSAPGIYQHQSPGSFEVDEQGNPNMDFGGYTGFTNVDPSGAAKYTSFAPNRNPQRGMPHNQIGQQGKGTGQRQAPVWGTTQGGGSQRPGGDRFGGRPNIGAGGRGQGWVGSTNPPRPGGGVNQRPGAGKPGGGRQRPGARANKPRPGAFPARPPQVPNFLPMTPGYEQDYRQANDQLTAAEGQYAASGSMIPAQIAQQQARLDTDQGVATDRLKEQLAERGIFTPWGGDSTAMNPQRAASPGGGGVGGSLYGRQVATPFGRARQDLGAQGAQAYQDRSLGYGGAQMGFNQQMFEALLGRSREAFEAMPLSLPIGGYELPEMAGPNFSTPGGGRQRPRRPRGRGNRGRNNRRR